MVKRGYEEIYITVIFERPGAQFCLKFASDLYCYIDGKFLLTE